MDWKTNLIAGGEVDTLRERYRPQIAAYWKAMIEITGFAIEAALYSTSTGSTLFYETDDLEREWRRLEQMPLDSAVNEISIA
jgi:hypothetical protein